MATSHLIKAGVTSLNFRMPTKALERLSDGTLIAAYQDHINKDIEFHYSTDDGETWADTASDITDLHATRGTGDNANSMRVDKDDQIWVIYFDTSGDVVIRRGVFAAGTITWDATFAIDTGLSVNAEVVMDVCAFSIDGDDYVGCLYANLVDNSEAFFLVAQRTGAGTYSIYRARENLDQADWQRPQIEFNHTGDGLTIQDDNPKFYCAGMKYDDVELDAVMWLYDFTYTPGPATWTLNNGNSIFGGGADNGRHLLWSDGDRLVGFVTTDSPLYWLMLDRNLENTSTINRGGGPIVGHSAATHIAVQADKPDRNIHFLSEDGVDLTTARWERPTNTWDADWSELEAGRRSLNWGPLQWPRGSYSMAVFWDAVAEEYRFIAPLRFARGGGGWGALGL